MGYSKLWQNKHGRLSQGLNMLTGVETKGHSRLRHNLCPSTQELFAPLSSWVSICVFRLFPHFFSSVSSRLTQIAAIIAKSTPGAHFTKYVCLSAKICVTLKKLLEICATACPPQVISADRSNQSPFTSISTGRPSAAFLKTT